MNLYHLKTLAEIEDLAYNNQDEVEESTDSIQDLLEEASTPKEARHIELAHSFSCLALTGETYVNRMDEGLKMLAEMKDKLIKALVLFNRAYIKGLLCSENIYEYRNYLYEGIARLECSRISDLCKEEEDIHKILWGLNTTINDLKELLCEEEEG